MPISEVITGVILVSFVLSAAFSGLWILDRKELKSRLAYSMSEINRFMLESHTKGKTIEHLTRSLENQTRKIAKFSIIADTILHPYEKALLLHLLKLEAAEKSGVVVDRRRETIAMATSMSISHLKVTVSRLEKKKLIRVNYCASKPNSYEVLL